MTRPPQPQPYPGDPETVLPGRVRHRHRYTDALGRPMTGVVSIINRTRLTPTDGVIVPASSARVDIGNDGWLDVQLPPGTYLLKAQLSGQDGGQFVDDHTVTLREP
jgi:hypothetical protein